VCERGPDIFSPRWIYSTRRRRHTDGHNTCSICVYSIEASALSLSLSWRTPVMETARAKASFPFSFSFFLFRTVADVVVHHSAEGMPLRLVSRVLADYDTRSMLIQ